MPKYDLEKYIKFSKLQKLNENEFIIKVFHNQVD